ncbi:MAG: hypothetical protein L0191_17675, partial [Acidobacteria bacterium]|nr:hypothetical protein [Acidobacteriota bacterium]
MSPQVKVATGGPTGPPGDTSQVLGVATLQLAAVLGMTPIEPHGTTASKGGGTTGSAPVVMYMLPQIAGALS